MFSIRFQNNELVPIV